MDSSDLDPPSLPSEGEANRASAVIMAGLFGGSVVVGERYRLGDEIGRGGLGVVRRALDLRLDRDVALKFPKGASGDPAIVRDLEREAKVLARLQHPNIVAVYDVGQSEQGVYLAMEFIEGASMAAWLRESKPGWKAVLEVMRAAGAGLAAAHEAGVVHRDFKPSNVMIDPKGRVRVVDFGLAREVVTTSGLDSEPSPDSTKTTAAGTPPYMAPEQFEGEVSAASDQFAFCTTLYEAVCGSRPWPGRVRGIASGRGAEIDRELRRHGLPKTLRRTVLRGLAESPGDRFGSMQTLLDGLRPTSRRALVGGVALAGMSVIGIGYTQSTDPCAARGTGASAFGGAAAEALRELGDDGTAGGELRQAADAWNEIDLATCEAHAAGSLSSTLYELRSRCLDRALAVGTSAADTVASGDYPLQKARRALVESIDAAACLDDEGLLLGAPEAGYDAVAGDAIQRAIDRAHVFHTLGDDAAWLSMLEDATANIQDREAVLPDALWLSMQLGEALVRSARLEDAQEVLMPAMLEAKKHPKWSRTLGMLQVQLAKLALARKDFKQAELWITLAEPSLSGLRQQQHAFAAAAAHAAIAAAGRPVDALALADAAEEIATNAGPVSDGWAGARALHAELDAVRCDALSKLGRNGEAVAACVRAEERFAELGVQSGRTFAVLLNHHALALKRAGKRDAAVPLFERSATLDEEAGRVESAAEVRVNLANLLDASGMHEQALREYDRAEHVLGDTRGKAWVSVHFNRSIARAGVGDWAGASGDARNALSANAELNPDDPAALYYQEVALGIAEAKLSRVEQAREVLELAIRHERDFHDPYSKAELRLALGGLVDSTRAKALFEEAVFFATESRDETLLGAARNALKSANTTGAR